MFRTTTIVERIMAAPLFLAQIKYRLLRPPSLAPRFRSFMQVGGALVSAPPHRAE